MFKYSENLVAVVVESRQGSGWAWW